MGLADAHADAECELASGNELVSLLERYEDAHSPCRSPSCTRTRCTRIPTLP
jgi:hypothetical protein